MSIEHQASSSFALEKCILIGPGVKIVKTCTEGQDRIIKNNVYTVQCCPLTHFRKFVVNFFSPFPFLKPRITFCL